MSPEIRTAHVSSFTGTRGVNTFRAIVIKSALLLYARTGMRANRAYTPRNMIRAAEEITGRKFKPRDYLGAADALDQWIELYGSTHD